MNREDARRSCVSLLMVSIFFVSCLYMKSFIAFETGVPVRETMLISDQNQMSVFHQQMEDVRLKANDLFELVQLKHSKVKCGSHSSSSLLQLTYLINIFLLSGVLFLGGKGRLFVCFITFIYLKARFLFELFIRKKKDGKKWIPAY